MAPRTRTLLAPRRLLALFLGTLVALGCAELVLRACAPPPAYRVWPPGLTTIFEPEPGVMQGVSGRSRFAISSLGFRASERPAGEPLSILCLGGSTTECLYLDQDEAWPALLEAALAARLGREVWVANAGKSGRTARDHVPQLAHLLAQEPRFARVVLLCGVNDLCSWLADEAHASAGDAEDAELLARAFDVLPRSVLPGPFWKRSALWELAQRLRARCFGPARVQDAAGAVYRGWRAHRAHARRILDELPDPAPARQAFRARLARMAETCAQHGVALVLVTQPALWAPGLAPELEARLWMGGVGDYQAQQGCDYYSAAALARGLELFDQTLRDFGAERGLCVLDLAAALPSDASLFYDDVHFSEAGARAAAAFLAHGLAQAEGR